MIKKGIVIMVIVFAGRLFFSCCDCGSGDEGRPTSVNTIALLPVDNSGKSPLIDQTGTIPKDAFAIRMVLSLSQITIRPKGFSLFPAAYACSCDNPYQLEPIASIKITTLEDFNSEYPAGSEITDLFKALKGKRYISLEEFIADPAFGNDYGSPIFENDFYLLGVPESGSHQFQIDIQFEDGLALSATQETNLE